MKISVPAPTGVYSLHRGERRFMRYVCAFLLIPVAFLLLAMGGIQSGTVDRQFYDKYRDMVVVDDAADQSPSTLSGLGEPVIGASYGGPSPDAADTGKDVVMWVTTLLNREQHVAGADPVVLEMGPFVYRRYRQLYDPEFVGPEEDLLRYHVREFYRFDPAKSSTIFSPTDQVTVPNPNWQLIGDEFAVLHPEARSPEDVLIGWFSSTIFQAVVLEATQQYRKIWFQPAMDALMGDVLALEYENNINQLAVDWSMGVTTNELITLDLRFVNPQTELIDRTVARAFWEGGPISLRSEEGNALILGALQERVAEDLDDWSGPEYVVYRDAFEDAFPSVYLLENDRRATIAVQLILNWTLNFVTGNTPHQQYVDDYVVVGYEDLGVIQQDSGFSFNDVIGMGMGSNGALGIFEKQTADVLRRFELIELDRFIASYNISGNETVPLEDALPPRQVFNELEFFTGTSLNNTCPDGASIYDEDPEAIRNRLVIGRPEFSCFTTGPEAPDFIFQSKVEPVTMAKLFTQFVCCNALFSPNDFPDVAPTALIHTGSYLAMRFFIYAEETLELAEVATTMAAFGQRIVDAQKFYLEQTPLTANASAAEADLNLLLDDPQVVAMNDVCVDRMVSADWGHLDCFQVHDLVVWMEYLAVNWYWLPELVTKQQTTRPTEAAPTDAEFLNAGKFVQRTAASVLFDAVRDNLYTLFTSNSEFPTGRTTPPPFPNDPNGAAWERDVLPTLEYEFEVNTGGSHPRLVNTLFSYKGLEELTTWEGTTPVAGSFDMSAFGADLQYKTIPPAPPFQEVWSFDALRPLNYTKVADLLEDDHPHQSRYEWTLDNPMAFQRFPADDRVAAPGCMVSLANINDGLDVLFGKPWGTGCDNITTAQIAARFPGTEVEPTEANYGSHLQYELLTGLTTEGVERKAWFFRYGPSRWFNTPTTIFPTHRTEEEFGRTDFLGRLASDVTITRFLVVRFYPHLFYLSGCVILLLAGGCFAWGMRVNGLQAVHGVQRHNELYVRPEDRIHKSLQRAKEGGR